MGLFSDVKCGRCDRRYSGLRARCPYCGARRGKRGKHARDKDNSTGRVVIGLILVVVLIVAVVAVIATNMTGQQPDAGDATLGGNITPIGASANITGIGILRKEGYPVKNSDFFKIGIPFTLAAIIPAYIYLWIFYGV